MIEKGEPVRRGLPARRLVVGCLVDLVVHGHPDRVAHLLGEVSDQPRRAGEQGEAAQDVRVEAEVAQRRPADAGSVERQA